MNTSFERAKHGKDEWLTPPELIKSLGEFDLDPCSPINRPWPTAKKHYTIEDMGLMQDWHGRVWMNPPYSAELVRQFVSKFAKHVNNKDISEGMVLVNNATETQWFNELVSVSNAVLFPAGRVKFLDPSGKPGAPLQGQALTYSGKNLEKFIDEFGGFGWIAKL